MINLDTVKRDLEWFDKQVSDLYKKAYTAAPPAPGPQLPQEGGAPPMDPSMQGGPPPMDPAMQGGAPPMDPSMQGGPPMDPSQGGAPPQQITPGMEQTLTQLATGVKDLANLTNTNSTQIAQLANQVEEMQRKMEAYNKVLSAPAAYEEGSSDPTL